jgi:hypothetical protein
MFMHIREAANAATYITNLVVPAKFKVLPTNINMLRYLRHSLTAPPVRPAPRCPRSPEIASS